MVEQGKVKMADAGAVKGHSPPGQQQQQHSTDVLHQRKKMPMSPMRLAIGGFAVTAVLGYLVLYSKKKPEASAMDVAKVTSGMAHPENTRPPN